MTRFVAGGHQTLTFTRSRRSAEIVAQYMRRRLSEIQPELADRVAAYRAGYLPAERRGARARAHERRLLGIAATNALELGIDVGGIDAVVLNGFPGTLASLRQQAGRAGRTGRRSAAVLVAGDDQLDQWYAAHPEELTRREPERAVVNPQNPFVMQRAGRVRGPRAAARSRGRTMVRRRPRRCGPRTRAGDLLMPRGGRMYWAGGRPPAPDVGLRSGSSVEYRLIDVDEERTVGTVDDARIFAVAHPGAVYLHQGRQYRVDRLDPTTTSPCSSSMTTPTNTPKPAPKPTSRSRALMPAPRSVWPLCTSAL